MCVCVCVHAQQGNTCVWQELCENSDVSTNLQTDTAQSTKIKRLPGYAVRLRVCEREIDGEKERDKERGSQTDTDRVQNRDSNGPHD